MTWAVTFELVASGRVETITVEAGKRCTARRLASRALTERVVAGTLPPGDWVMMREQPVTTPVRTLALALLLCGLWPAWASAQPQQNTGIFSRLWVDRACTVDTGAGSPEGTKTGIPCDVYLRTDGGAGTVIYVKETGTGTTGWTALGAAGGGSAHAILSATHSDTLPNAPTRGAILTGQTATPVWGRLSLGAAGTFLRSNGTDPLWSSDGSSLTALNASALTTGTVAAARLGTGTPSSSTFLRGDGTWTSTTTTAHDLLSSEHGDTTAASPTRGDLITSQGAGAEWTRLAVGAANSILRSDGTDPAWTTTPQIVRLGIGTAADATVALTINGQYHAIEQNAGNVTGATAIDWDDGVQHRMVATGDVTFTLNNPVEGGRYMLILQQDGSGGHDWNFPASVKWTGGVEPTWTTTASAVDIVTLAYTGANGGMYISAANLDIK